MFHSPYIYKTYEFLSHGYNFPVIIKSNNTSYTYIHNVQQIKIHRMGCSSSSSTELQQRILPLPIDIINAYIDRVSIVMINKIRHKLLTFTNQNTDQIDENHFLTLFKHSQLSSTRVKSLFAYFNNNSGRGVRVNKFIEKYCILVKSDAVHFSQIIHKIFCKSVEYDKLTQDDFFIFHNESQSYLKQRIPQIPNQKFPLSWTQFYQLTKNVVNWQQYQNSFHIVTIDELPYKSFHEQLQKFNMEVLVKGEKYFVVSEEWISQWQIVFSLCYRIFFYEYEDTDIKNSSYRSNRSSQIMKKKTVTVPRKQSKNRLQSSKLFSSHTDQQNLSLLPPTQINMNEIQGEYIGQLKPFLNVERDIAVINSKMWEILKNTLGSTVEFQRQAIDQYNLDLYPIFAYLYHVDKDASISPKDFQIRKAKRTSLQTQFKMLSYKPKHEKIDTLLYYKNYQSINFYQWTHEKSLQDFVNEHPRVIIVELPVHLQDKFVQKYQRKELNSENITIGDKVLAYFSYQDKFVQAYVIHVKEDKKQFKVHFIGFSYNYERWVKSTDIKLLQHNQQQQEKTEVVYERQRLFWGIPNVGNTCFINSILQSLTSTSIFDQFFLKANFPSKKYPLSYDFANVLKGLLNRQKFNILDFKKAINNTMPIFAGYDQHDAQQFLNLLLDKLDSQLNQKPNIIDQLFGGIMQSKFTCLQCKFVKHVREKIHSISLPIPESENNYFIIIVFPIYSPSVKRIVLRLNKNSRVVIYLFYSYKQTDYLSEIERRTNIRRQDMLYVETQCGVLKRFRNQLVIQANQDKKLTQMGLNSNIEIWMYQKLRDTSIDYQLHKNKVNINSKSNKMKPNKSQNNNMIVIDRFYDYYSNEEACWGIARVKAVEEESIRFEFLKDNVIKTFQMKREPNVEEYFNQLGTKFGDKIYRKIFMRKWSPTSQKMIIFGNQFFIGIPRWSSYKDTLVFFDQYLQKMRKKSQRSSSNSRVISLSSSCDKLQSSGLIQMQQLRLTGLSESFLQDKKLPYIIHMVQSQKNICIFCHKQLQVFHSQEQIKRCCQPQQQQVPLFWASTQRFVYFIVDWVDMDEYNQVYLNNVQVDKMSKVAEEKMKQQRISLQDCIQLWKKPQTIQMQCQTCKHDSHLLQTSIKKAPIITVFHLKQFRYTQQGHFVKLNINLNWTDSINLQSYYSNPEAIQKGSVYEMYSVISHRGNTNSGHYTCMAKRKHPLEKIKVWVNFDDEKTEILAEKPQYIDNAYLLFFKKVDLPSSAVVHFSM